MSERQRQAAVLAVSLSLSPRHAVASGRGMPSLCSEADACSLFPLWFPFAQIIALHPSLDQIIIRIQKEQGSTHGRHVIRRKLGRRQAVASCN